MDTWLDLSNILADLGIQKEAILILQRQLPIVETDEKKATILVNIGSIHANMDDHYQAINHYNQAISLDPNKYIFWKNRATSFGYLMDFISAIRDIEHTLELMDEDNPHRFLCEIEQIYFKSMVKNRLNLNRIDSDATKIINTLESAERFYLQAKRNQEIQALDASTNLLGYTKGLEIMLHSNISLPFIDYLRNHYNYYIPDNIWTNSKDNIIKFLKTTEGEQQITLGRWKKILENIQLNDPLSCEFHQFTNSHISTEVLNLLSNELTTDLVDIRNFGTHEDVINFSVFEEKRIALVHLLNKLIDIFY